MILSTSRAVTGRDLTHKLRYFDENLEWGRWFPRNGGGCSLAWFGREQDIYGEIRIRVFQM